MKLDADEKELLESVERGEWKSAKGGKRERTRYSRYAKAPARGPAASVHAQPSSQRLDIRPDPRRTPFRRAREVGEERGQPPAPPRRFGGLARRPIPEHGHLGVDPRVPVLLSQLCFERLDLGSPLGGGRRRPRRSAEFGALRASRLEFLHHVGDVRLDEHRHLPETLCDLFRDPVPPSRRIDLDHQPRAIQPQRAERGVVPVLVLAITGFDPG